MRVNRCVDLMENKMAKTASGITMQKLSKNIVTSTVKKNEDKKVQRILSDSSSDKSDKPSLHTLKPHKFQRQVDKRVRGL